MGYPTSANATYASRAATGLSNVAGAAARLTGGSLGSLYGNAFPTIDATLTDGILVDAGIVSRGGPGAHVLPEMVRPGGAPSILGTTGEVMVGQGAKSALSTSSSLSTDYYVDKFLSQQDWLNRWEVRGAESVVGRGIAAGLFAGLDAALGSLAAIWLGKQAFEWYNAAKMGRHLSSGGYTYPDPSQYGPGSQVRTCEDTSANGGPFPRGALCGVFATAVPGEEAIGVDVWDPDAGTYKVEYWMPEWLSPEIGSTVALPAVVVSLYDVPQSDVDHQEDRLWPKNRPLVWAAPEGARDPRIGPHPMANPESLPPTSPHYSPTPSPIPYPLVPHQIPDPNSERGNRPRTQNPEDPDNKPRHAPHDWAKPAPRPAPQPPGWDWPTWHKPPLNDPPYRLRPPQKGEKERKFNGWQGAVMAHAISMTEVDDAIGSIYDALPKHCQRGWIAGKPIGTAEKFQRVYKCINEVDWPQAARNVIVNEVSDRAIGFVHGKLDKAKMLTKGEKSPLWARKWTDPKFEKQLDKLVGEALDPIMDIMFPGTK